MKKRTLTYVAVCIAVCLVALMACSGSPKKKVNEESSVVKQITVTTSFIQDMVEQLLPGKDIKIEVIVPAGEDPHLYEAQPNDMKKINNADLVIYHGLHFEGKMEEILQKRGVSISKNFPPDRIGQMEENGQMIIDPHFWFDIPLYKMAFKEVAIELAILLPEYKDDISKNEAGYLIQLDDLDVYIRKELAKIPKSSRYLITPHDAFNYFSHAYDVQVIAPQGVSTEGEVSASDINQTVSFIVEHKVKAIFAESTTDPARMEKLRESAKNRGFDVKVVSGHNQELYSDSLAPKGEKGDTYIDMYKHNVDLMVTNLQ